MKYPCQGRSGLSRRGFLVGAGLGLAGTLGAGCSGPKPVAARKADGMPGPFPGRVIEVYHPDAVSESFAINAKAVSAMVDRGMKQLTRSDSAAEAWARLFNKEDIVGIKVNPVGQRKGKPQSISSHELVEEVVAGLKGAGVKPDNIILFERYAKQFREAGYEDLLKKPTFDKVRWYAASYEYENTQLDIEGFGGPWASLRHVDPKVLGYDPDQSVSMGFAHPEHDPHDDRRFHSHLSMIVSRMVNKVINLPVLKDHGSAGVTLALKNMSHGFFNNVCRSHLPKVPHDQAISGPNQCNTFIPTVLTHPLVRQKTVLHILDGLVGVWQGGPSSYSGCVWAEKSLFFATDPVAMDRVGWARVDAKRVEKGLPVVAKTGMQFPGQEKEAFDRRQPEHIILAGSIGLGTFDQLDHHRIKLS